MNLLKKALACGAILAVLLVQIGCGAPASSSSGSSAPANPSSSVDASKPSDAGSSQASQEAPKGDLKQIPTDKPAWATKQATFNGYTFEVPDNWSEETSDEGGASVAIYLPEASDGGSNVNTTVYAPGADMGMSLDQALATYPETLKTTYAAQFGEVKNFEAYGATAGCGEVMVISYEVVYQDVPMKQVQYWPIKLGAAITITSVDDGTQPSELEVGAHMLNTMKEAK